MTKMIDLDELEELAKAAREDCEGPEWHRFWDQLSEDDLIQLIERVREAEARITKTAKLHQCFETHNGFQWCSGCSSDEYPEDWPCPTAVALGLNEGETKHD